LSVFFLQQKIPLLPVICLLPFITGMLTGLTVGFVGGTFPLLISMTGGPSLASMSIAFAAGFIGVLLSPVHLCLILTKEYFKADLWVFTKILPASAIIFIAAIMNIPPPLKQNNPGYPYLRGSHPFLVFQEYVVFFI
jgi:hypothetical protein